MGYRQDHLLVGQSIVHNRRMSFCITAQRLQNRFFAISISIAHPMPEVAMTFSMAVSKTLCFLRSFSVLLMLAASILPRTFCRVNKI